MIALSTHAAELLLSARKPAPGCPIMSTNPSAALREFRDHGLVNSHFRLTRRGAAEHAERNGTCVTVWSR